MGQKALKFEGMWQIQEIEMWDEDYLNMEVKAYICIEPNGMGNFQFGLVSGQLDWEEAQQGEKQVLFFTWDGNDECDPAQGAGWLTHKDENVMEG